MSLLEIIKKLRLIEIKVYFKDFLKFGYNPTEVKIGNLTIDSITLEQFEEIKRKSIETIKEISKMKKDISELSDYFKEAAAKAIIAKTIFINISNLRKEASKGLIKPNPGAIVNLLIKCKKCGKFFNSGIAGNLQSLMSSEFINNTHQCRFCGNMQLAKDNSEYFIKYIMSQDKSLNKINEITEKSSFEKIKKEKWYQTWWGQLLLMVIGGVIIAFLIYNLGF